MIPAVWRRPPPSDAADAMPQRHAIGAAGSLHGSMTHGEQETIPLSQRHDHGPRLHTRALLDHDEFAAAEVFLGLGQQNRKLQRKHLFTVKVLVQAIIVVLVVLEEERCRLR